MQFFVLRSGAASRGGVLAEIVCDDLGITRDHGARSRVDDAPLLDHVGAIAARERLARVLLDEQDGQTLGVQQLERIEHLANHERREAETRLIEQQEPRRAHEGARPIASICC